jgi:hypothetical protein
MAPEGECATRVRADDAREGVDDEDDERRDLSGMRDGGMMFFRPIKYGTARFGCPEAKTA